MFMFCFDFFTIPHFIVVVVDVVTICLVLLLPEFNVTEVIKLSHSFRSLARLVIDTLIDFISRSIHSFSTRNINAILSYTFNRMTIRDIKSQCWATQKSMNHPYKCGKILVTISNFVELSINFSGDFMASDQQIRMCLCDNQSSLSFFSIKIK